MPGRLLLGQYHTTKERTMEDGSAPQKDTKDLANGDSVADHAASAPSVDAPRPSNPKAPANAELAPLQAVKSAREPMAETPPELPHIFDGYQPLSRLFERSAQECFNSLNALLSDLQNLDGATQVNGSPDPADARSLQSDEKRRRWLHFAKDQREHFLALWVILQWGRSSRESIGKLVDVVAWMRQREATDEHVHETLGLLRREMSEIKIPNPDISLALKVLSCSPPAKPLDPRYFPPPTLSPQTLLADLRNINTLLHIRLNLHETLPAHLRHFAIHSGRVTFTVEREFELDLSILDQDPSSRFYFVDFRFLFSPSSEIPPGALRLELEVRANAVLAAEGLVGCFDFLRDYVLTYKLSVLRRQALELARGSWSGSLRVDRIHRSTMIQYWTDRPAKKSWIEIGVQSGRSQASADTGLSRLNVKWTCNGMDMSKEETIHVDDQNLDVEVILKDVVTRHIRHLMRRTADDLMSRLSPAAGSAVRVAFADEQTLDCSLTVPLYSTQSASLRIEPITGRFAISPISHTSTQTEAIFDRLRTPFDQLAHDIVAWRHQDAAVTFQARSSRRHWQRVRGINLDATVRRQVFGDSNAVPSFYKRWQNPQWVVAVCPDGDSGYDVWVLEIFDADPSSYENVGSQIVQTAQKLQLDKDSLSIAFFADLEKVSLAFISSTTFQRRLRDLHMPYTSELSVESNLLFPTLRVDLQNLGNETLMSKRLTFVYRRLEPGKGRLSQTDTVVHVARGTLKQGPSLPVLISSIASPSIAIQQNGVFAVAVQSPVGSTNVVDKLLAKVAQISWVHSFVDALMAYNIKVKEVSLESVSFAYGTHSAPLQARLRKPSSESGSLVFTPADNPHHRIQQLLLPLLRRPVSKQTTALSKLPQVLLTTLPLFRAFDTIEAKRAARIHVINIESYSVVYARPRCIIKVQYRSRQDQSWWQVVQEYPKLAGLGQTVADVNQSLLRALRQHFAQSDQDGVKYLKSGLAAQPETVEFAILALDEVVRGCANGEPEPKKAQPNAEPVAQPKNGNEPAQSQLQAQAQDAAQSLARVQAQMQASKTGPPPPTQKSNANPPQKQMQMPGQAPRGTSNVDAANQRQQGKNQTQTQAQNQNQNQNQNQRNSHASNGPNSNNNNNNSGRGKKPEIVVLD